MTSTDAMGDDAEDDDDEGYNGHVIVSAGIFSPVELPAVAAYQVENKVGDGVWIYRLGTTTFEERASEPRAEILRATIDHYLDLIGRVPREDLHHPDAFVRVFMTLPRGAETIDAATVKRLAEVNATLWIDA